MPESAMTIAASTHGAEYVRKFESFGYNVVTAPDSTDQLEALLSVASRIRDARPHILITSAALADFNHYFIAAVRPAPLVVGLVQGPPPQFAPPSLDWCIAWSKHPLVDCPVSCSLVELMLDLPERKGVLAHSREEFGLPAAARVLLSGGRHVKFQEPEFWRAISSVLNDHKEAYYIVVGARKEEISFFDSVIPQEISVRIFCLGWRSDFQQILGLADVIIDTYPNGGGQSLVEAMALGIPVVAHRNDYMTLFDQTNWSPAEDFIAEPELLIPRGDFRAFRQVISRLIMDEEFRVQMGERCRMHVVQQGAAERGVRRIEEILESLVLRSQTKNHAV